MTAATPHDTFCSMNPRALRTLALSRENHARVAWEPTITARSDRSLGALRASVAATTRAQPAARAVMLEALYALGPRQMYGMLAFDFESSAGDNVEIEVSYTSEPGPEWTGGLVAPYEIARLGLALEFAPAVLAAAQTFAERLLPAGRLSLRAAAYGEISSCDAFFARITEAALALMAEGPTEDAICAERIREILRPR